jgi:HupE / UreJ protein
VNAGALRLWPCLLALLVASTPVGAHTRSQSFSSWSADGAEVAGVFQVDARRVTQLSEEATIEDLGPILMAHLGRSVNVTQAGISCAARPPRELAAAHGDLRVELVFDCGKPLADVPAAVSIGAFFDVSPSHVHYARVTGASGRPLEALATAGAHVVELGGRAEPRPTDLQAFLRLGLQHVLSGADHLAFIAALALLAGSFGRAVWAATGFTLGHSLTLGLVAAGWLSPDSRAIESLIGFTVAFAAGEAFVARAGVPSRAGWAIIGLVAAVPLLAKLVGATTLPWVVAGGTATFALCAGGLGSEVSRRLAPLLAAAFGLAHGAGFAGALIDLDIPRERLLKALLGFNLGVEVAQVLALSMIALLTLACSRLPPTLRRQSANLVVAAIFALGVYWFVGRSLA